MMSNPAICPTRRNRPADPEAKERAIAKAQAKRDRKTLRRAFISARNSWSNYVDRVKLLLEGRS